MVVARNITVEAGGTLDLDGCILAFASPPYDNKVFSGKDEGLVLTILEGGMLRIHASPGRPAGMERADARYGYTVQALGDIEVIGVPGTPARISGLEGAHQDRLALGGMQARGHVKLREALFERNDGPGLFMLDDSVLEGDRVMVREGSGFSATRAKVHLSNLTIDAGWTALALSRGPASIEDCSLSGGQSGVYVAYSNLTLRRCRIDSNQTALRSENANLFLDRTNVTFGGYGFQALFTAKHPELPNLLHLANSSVLPRQPAPVSAILAVRADILLEDSRLEAPGPAVNASEPDLVARRSHIAGNPPLRLLQPGSVVLDQVHFGSSPGLHVLRATVVTVHDGQGNAVRGAKVTVAGIAGTTNGKGTAVVTWPLAQGDSIADLHPFTAVRLTAADDQGNEVSMEVPVEQALVEVTLGGSRGIPASWWSGVAAMAFAALASRRRR